MATNNLAPKNVNVLRSLAEHPNPLQYLMQLASERPEYAALTDYLTSRSAMPPVSFGSLPAGTNAEFGMSGGFNSKNIPETGAITLSNKYLNKGYDPTNAVPTLTHELTHAAQGEISKQRSQKEVLDKNAKQQFLDAYKKLIFNPDGFKTNRARYAQGVLADKLNPAWVKENKDYRSSIDELPAWAMGAAAHQNPLYEYDDYNAPAHLNPTLATEYQILLDLATRDAKANPKKKKQ
jgi:hypothetical protein